jgi:hypothetical protein
MQYIYIKNHKAIFAIFLNYHAPKVHKNLVREGFLWSAFK